MLYDHYRDQKHPEGPKNTLWTNYVYAPFWSTRRYGASMIYLKLRQDGLEVNHKRVERLYAEAGLQVKRRQRKKIPVADRQPLYRPQHANEVWSMDFVFDRSADGRLIKCLTVVDDATHESVAP